MTSRRSPFRARLGLFVVLGALLAANLAVLISYSYFYDSRVQSLVATRKELEKKLVDTRAAADQVVATEKRLAGIHERLESFFSDTLGARKERLATIIEEVYAITKKLGMRPEAIGYQEAEEAGVDRFGFSFRVQGSYADIKRLLFELESSKSFFVLEKVGVGTDETQPDLLTVNLDVAHYFRGEETKLPRRTTRATTASAPLTPPKASTRQAARAAGKTR